MSLIFRAIITGFGYKLGSELARYVATKAGLIEESTAKKESKEEDIPAGVTTVEDPLEQRDDEDDEES